MLGWMGKAASRILSTFGVRREELGRVVPLTVAYALVLASLYVLKPARNALFLSKLGVEQLPYVLLLVAAVGGGFALVYGRLTRSLTIDALVQRTFLGLMLVLGGFRLLLERSPPGWVFYTFYVWVALYGLIATSLVWLLANGVFTSREARRVFGLIGSGGIAGAIIGGLFTGQLAEHLGTENLLIVCIGLLAGCVVLFRTLPPSSQTAAAPRRGEERASSGLAYLLESDLLRNLALATGLIAAVAVIVDVQFNEVVDRAYATQDQKAAFFGWFFASLSAFSFVFQLLLTPRILRVVGVGAALTILPTALGLGSLGLLLVPGLLSGMAVKGADGGFRHSVHKAASEVLFLPVPSEVKKQGKLFLDTTVDTTATGVGALAVLLLVDQIGVSYESLGVLSVALIAGTLVVIRRIRVAYVDAFRQALESRRIDLAQLRTSLAEAGAIELLRPALRSDRPRQIVYVLDLLSEIHQRALVPELDRLLAHPSVEVRKRALALREKQDPPSSREQLESLLGDENLEIRARALALLAATDPDEGEARLGAALEASSPKLRAAALGALAELGPEAAEARLNPEDIRRWLEDASFGPLRAELARALGRLAHPSLDSALGTLLVDAPPAVVRAAIEGIGQGRNRAWLPWLIDRLESPEHRSAARSALAGFGAEVVPRIAELLDRPELASSVRRALPRVLGRIPTQSSVEVLMAHLDTPDPLLARSVHRALAKLRLGYEDLRFDRRRVREAILRSARRHHEVTRAERDLASAHLDGPAGALLLRSLREAKAWEVDAVLDLLVLRHDPDDIESARRGLRRGALPERRASALELLENVIDKNCRAPALAVLDDTDREAQLQRAAALFGDAPRTPDAALVDLLNGQNAWLRACAAHVGAERPNPELRARVEAARHDAHRFVREAARRALEPLGA